MLEDSSGEKVPIDIFKKLRITRGESNLPLKHSGKACIGLTSK